MWDLAVLYNVLSAINLLVLYPHFQIKELAIITRSSTDKTFLYAVG